MSTATSPIAASRVGMSHARVILAASLGTGFEWYDFFLYGSLAGVISKQFFTGVNETTGFIFALLTFAAGFAVRPFGALLFGRLGDLVGRKKTFLATIIIMGIATTLVGVLPNYQSVGIAAPMALIALRMLQGLAIGGEYGGAAIYVAEHAPPGKRGRYTSWIQTTATLALLLSLTVVLACRALFGADFDTWGWRIPFLLSTVLLAISVYIRLQLAESPVFLQMVAEGSRSRAPIRDAFGDRGNLKLMLAALFGATAGMNVVWYGGQLYALFFLTQVLKVEAQTASLLLAAALVIGTPLYLVFGRLSDHVGRKKIVLLGMALAASTYFPIYHAITHFANPAIEEAAQRAPVDVLAAPGDCSLQFDPIGKSRFVKSCDTAKAALAKAGVPYTTEVKAAGGVAVVRIGHPGEGATDVSSFDGARLSTERFKQENDTFGLNLKRALSAAGYPAQANPRRIDYPMVLLMLLILMVYVTLVTGPMAAWLVELFPARVRYTSMSVPYHIGAGWFGGFLPAVAFMLVAITGDLYSGLWYPVIVVLVTLVAGVCFLPETAGRRVRAAVQ
ncbi:MAG TPA: MFS transporter [Steroidobacteraceae bacterium]|jgi:MFS family permease|nr:MFS transporter [Steroidobacteraceae bacterium]